MYFCVRQWVATRGDGSTGPAPRTARNGTIMPNHSVQADGDERVEVAIYVASMSADLATMARRTGLDTLGYLLEMVRLEAENAARNMPGPDGGV